MNQFTTKKPGHDFVQAHAGHDGEECLIWPFSCNTAGYGSYGLNKRPRMAHREMCRLVHGEPPTPAHQAAHSCGNRRCVNPKHLSWKTPQENQWDRRDHGTQTVKGRRKITMRQVEQIRQLKGKETSIATAARYGITESNVRLIQDGKIWKTSGRKHSLLLTDEQVRLIRRIGRSQSIAKTARSIGVKAAAVRRVLIGKTYLNVA